MPNNKNRLVYEITFFLMSVQNTELLIFEDNIPKKFELSDFEAREIIFKKDNDNYVQRFLYKPIARNVVVKHLTVPYSRSHPSECEKIKKDIENEINNFRVLSESENIVNFYGINLSSPHVAIVMESMDYSLHDLYTKVYEKRTMFSEEVLGVIIARIVDALDFCKSRNIMHRDVKPGNVLVNKSGEIKLCDFGLSKILDSKSKNWINLLLRIISNFSSWHIHLLAT